MLVDVVRSINEVLNIIRIADIYLKNILYSHQQNLVCEKDNYTGC